MPRGSDYQGPEEALGQYKAVVDASSGDAVVKGAKNPYTSRNGHMFSFLDADGSMALRLPDKLGEEFRSIYDSGPVIQYGSVMRGYVSVPVVLLAEAIELATWFDKAYDWIGTLVPKPTKRKK
jgi:hypothetical protein